MPKWRGPSPLADEAGLCARCWLSCSEAECGGDLPLPFPVFLAASGEGLRALIRDRTCCCCSTIVSLSAMSSEWSPLPFFSLRRVFLSEFLKVLSSSCGAGR